MKKNMGNGMKRNDTPQSSPKNEGTRAYPREMSAEDVTCPFIGSGHDFPGQHSTERESRPFGSLTRTVS